MAAEQTRPLNCRSKDGRVFLNKKNIKPMEMEFKKIKLIKSAKAHIVYSLNEADGKKKTITEDSDAKPHEDFIHAMDRIRVHFAILTGYLKPADVKDPETFTGPAGFLEGFKVSSVSISGEEEDQGVVISGHRNLPVSNKAVILNSPFTRINEDDKTRYKFMDELVDQLDEIKGEAKKFIGGKFEADPQQELFEKENVENEAAR